MGVHFPEVASVYLPTRGAKQYCRVIFNPGTPQYDQLGHIRTFLSGLLKSEVYLTSGGPSGGTFRLNPD